MILAIDLGISTGVAIYDNLWEEVITTDTLIPEKLIEFMDEAKLIYNFNRVIVERPTPVSISKFNKMFDEMMATIIAYCVENKIEYMIIGAGEWKTTIAYGYYRDGSTPHENDAACIGRYGFLRLKEGKWK